MWIKQPGSGLDKRQATLQLLIRGEGQQPKPVLIFRGKKKPSRRCDQQARASFVARELKDEPYLLLCDNLNG